MLLPHGFARWIPRYDAFMLLTMLTILTHWTATWPPYSEAASFDCQKTTHAAEKLICADTELNSIDTAMGKRYSEIRALASKAEADVLRKEQLAWLRERNACATQSDPINCMKKLYEQRFSALAKYLVSEETASQTAPQTAPPRPEATATPPVKPPPPTPVAPLHLSAEGLGTLNKHSVFDQATFGKALSGYTLESTRIQNNGKSIQMITAHRQGKPAIRFYSDAARPRIAHIIVLTAAIHGPNNVKLGTNFDTVAGKQAHLFNCEAGSDEFHGLVLCYFDQVPMLRYAFEPTDWPGPVGELPPRRDLQDAKLVQFVWIAH